MRSEQFERLRHGRCGQGVVERKPSPGPPSSASLVSRWRPQLSNMVLHNLPRRAQMHPCSPASRSTSHHELFALPKMVLNLEISRRTNKIVKCTLAHVIVTLFTRQSSHCSDLYDTTRFQSSVECRPNQTPVPHRGSYLCVIRSASNQ